MSVHAATERVDGRLTFTLLDSVGAAVPLAAIVAATLTLTDVDTGALINSRNGQDVLNVNDVTIHATSGLVTWNVLSADNPIVTPTAALAHELHRAVFRFTYSVSKVLIVEEFLLVKNIHGVS